MYLSQGIQDTYSQELYSPQDAEATANVHSNDEVMAQSICTSITNFRGWTYAVQRLCLGPTTCRKICTSLNLRNQDPRTRGRQWYVAAALHVYTNRPSSRPGTASNPHIGLKVYNYANINQSGCGPNWCCCHVPA